MLEMASLLVHMPATPVALEHLWWQLKILFTCCRLGLGARSHTSVHGICTLSPGTCHLAVNLQRIMTGQCLHRAQRDAGAAHMQD